MMACGGEWNEIKVQERKKIIEMWGWQWKKWWTVTNEWWGIQCMFGWVLMTSSLLLEKRLSSLTLLSSSSCASQLSFCGILNCTVWKHKSSWHTQHVIHSLLSLSQVMVSQKLWVKTTGCVKGQGKMNKKWYQFHVMDKRTFRQLYFTKVKIA